MDHNHSLTKLLLTLPLPRRAWWRAFG